MATVVTYDWAYGGGSVDLCSQHSTSEAAGAPLGQVSHGAHSGDCAVCVWGVGAVAVGDDGLVWGVGPCASVAESDARTRLRAAGRETYLALYRRGHSRVGIGDRWPHWSAAEHAEIGDGVFVGA